MKRRTVGVKWISPEEVKGAPIDWNSARTASCSTCAWKPPRTLKMLYMDQENSKKKRQAPRKRSPTSAMNQRVTRRLVTTSDL